MNLLCDDLMPGGRIQDSGSESWAVPPLCMRAVIRESEMEGGMGIEGQFEGWVEGRREGC